MFCTSAILSRVWVAEDAYITFRVVENLFSGNGLVLNPGDRVEAFTHPLWMLCLMLARGVGVDLHLGALVLGLALSLGGICALLFDGRRPRVFLAAPALCALSGFRDFATAGMEFSLVFVLLVYLDRLLDGNPLRKRPAAIAAVLSLLYLTRPELLLGSLAYSAMIGFDILRPGSHYSGVRERLRTAARWVVPSVLIVGGWHAFRGIYYGDIFPNTYYAKSGAESYTIQGIRYLAHTLVHSPSIWPALVALVVFVCVHSARALVRPRRWMAGARDMVFPLLLVGYWVRAGGDFMSFRVLLPPIVLLVLVSQRMVSELQPTVGRRPERAALLASPIAGFLTWAVFVLLAFVPAPFARGYIADERQVFTRDLPRGLVTAVLSPGSQPWAERGKAFRALQRCLRVSELRITNSQAAAGCLRGVGLGYFGVAAGAGVLILDEQGLPNRDVALQPVVERFRPGHEHFVTLRDALRYGATFCSTAEPGYDRVMVTPAGIVVSLRPEILLTLPRIEERLAELAQLKRAGSNVIRRLERRYAVTIETLQLQAAQHRNDRLLNSMNSCWTRFPGGPETFFY